MIKSAPIDHGPSALSAPRLNMQALRWVERRVATPGAIPASIIS
jgi:hypothetical protein